MTNYPQPSPMPPERSSSGEVRYPPESLAFTLDRVVGDPGSSWDVATKRTVVIIMLIAMIAIVWLSRPVIPLLVIAGVVAYLLNPIVDLCERLHIPRAVSTIVVFMMGLVGLILLPIVLTPILVQQLASLNFDVPSTAFRLFGWLRNMIINLPDTVEVMGYTVPLDSVTQQLEANFQNFTFIPTLAEILSYFQQLISTATNLVSSTAAFGVSLVGSIVQVLFTFLFLFFLSLYMTKDAPRIRAYVEGLFPPTYQSEWIDLLRRIGHIWQAFFRGQLLLCVIIGIITWLALELAGMPGALILGILAGALEILPNVGPVLSMIPAVIVALIQGSDVLAAYGVNNFGFALITVAIYFIIQQAENNILVPRIIGGGVNLHPIVVLCGVLVGFNVGGVLGALFAAPVIASLRVIGSYIHAKLLDYPPFYDYPPLHPRRGYTYRRTVTGDELARSAAPPPDPSPAEVEGEDEEERAMLRMNPSSGSGHMGSTIAGD